MSFAQPAATALWFLPFAAPIAIWAAWSDLATMKIPNKAVVALTAVYLAVGLVAMPSWEAYGLRLVHLVVGHSRLLSLVTVDAVQKLALAPGVPILALIKAVSVEAFA